MKTLRSLAFFAPTILLVACGGNVGGANGAIDGSVDDAPAETGDDALPDAMPDVGGCGVGPCKPGMACSDGCNECRCQADGSWACTGRYCPDADPPPPPPPCPFPIPEHRSRCYFDKQFCTYVNACGSKDTASCVAGPEGLTWIVSRAPCGGACPATRPTVGTTCPAPLKCPYKNSCGGEDLAYCNFAGDTWKVAIGPCAPPPSCPPSLPKGGTACSGPVKCSYPKACGTSDFASCDGTSSTWNVLISECPPPSCPSTMPPDGTSCPSKGMECMWNNGCGNVAYGQCTSTGWSVKNPGCVKGCPSSKPTSGVSCAPPSSTACTYVVSGTKCTSACFCAEDYRWACISEPCTAPPSPPGG